MNDFESQFKDFLVKKQVDTDTAAKATAEQKLERQSRRQASVAEITPGQIEKIMQRVQDIDSKGLAYSAIAYSKLDVEGNCWDFEKNALTDCLKYGILGQVSWYDQRHLKPGREHSSPAATWAIGVRDQGEGVVFFNIIGRSREKVPAGKTQIETTSYPTCADTVSIIFDSTSFQEVTPEEDRNRRGQFGSLGHKKFTAFQYGRDTEYKLGESSNTTDFGFILSHRLAPREFKGVVISDSTFEALPEGKPIEARTLSNDKLVRRAEEVAGLMIESNPDKVNPIYDVHGNLLWPKQMTYEEVKKIVVEREKTQVVERREKVEQESALLKKLRASILRYFKPDSGPKL